MLNPVGQRFDRIAHSDNGVPETRIIIDNPCDSTETGETADDSKKRQQYVHPFTSLFPVQKKILPEFWSKISLAISSYSVVLTP